MHRSFCESRQDISSGIITVNPILFVAQELEIANNLLLNDNLKDFANNTKEANGVI